MEGNIWRADGWPFAKSKITQALNDLDGEEKIKQNWNDKTGNFVRAIGNHDVLFLLTNAFPLQRPGNDLQILW